MKPVCSFLVKFASLISWMISCFDRVIFKGHLPISRSFELENFVDYVLKMRRADFMEKIAPQWSERLVQYAKGFARNAGQPGLLLSWRSNSFKVGTSRLSISSTFNMPRKS